jgi:hypothetical protein
VLKSCKIQCYTIIMIVPTSWFDYSIITNFHCSSFNHYNIHSLQQNMGAFHCSISLKCHSNENDKMVFHITTTTTHAHCHNAHSIIQYKSQYTWLMTWSMKDDFISNILNLGQIKFNLNFKYVNNIFYPLCFITNGNEGFKRYPIHNSNLILNVNHWIFYTTQITLSKLFKRPWIHMDLEHL